MRSSGSKLDLNNLLNLAKKTANQARRMLSELESEGKNHHHFDSKIKREMKAEVDKLIEQLIVEALTPTGIPILSEESGLTSSLGNHNYQFIVDPIDGTVNFIRKISSSTISIALFHNDQPVFGVLAIYPDGGLAWGGPGIGAFLNDNPMQVSSLNEESQAVLCSGIPSRLNLDCDANAEKFLHYLNLFAKVRMLGSASVSLLQVAKGAADAYIEQDVMIWDVAAGLALVLGAGGSIDLKPGLSIYSRKVTAQNGQFDSAGWLA